MEPTIAILVFLAGFGAAFVGGIVGGGAGLISIPALIFLGLPANIAIATNRFGNFGWGASAIYKFNKAKKIAFKHVLPLTVAGIAGVLIGTKFLIEISETLLSKMVGILILLSVPLLFLKKDFGLKTRDVSKNYIYLGYLSYFFIGIYDGFFGGAGGIFAMFVLIHLLGLTFIRANATDKIPWFIGLFLSLAILGFVGLINFVYGFLLLAGMFAGGYVGAHTAIKKGNEFVRYAFAAVVIVSALKLLFF